MAKAPIIEVLKAMVDAQATDTVIASTVRALVSQEVLLDERRHRDRQRKRVKQTSRPAAEQASEQVCVPETVEFHAEFRAENAPNSARKTSGIPPPDEPHTSFEEREVRKKDAAAACAREEFQIAERVAAICRCPQLPTDPEHVAGWLAAGFAEPFILAVAKAVMGRRRPPAVGRIDYLDGPLADERERQRKLLPLEVRAAVKTISENPDVRRTPATGWRAARDDGRAAFSEFTQALRNDALKGSGGSG